jgi:hypothetical protein
MNNYIYYIHNDCTVYTAVYSVAYNTREQDFGTWKVYCVYNVTFKSELKLQ